MTKCSKLNIEDIKDIIWNYADDHPLKTWLIIFTTILTATIAFVILGIFQYVAAIFMVLLIIATISLGVFVIIREM